MAGFLRRLRRAKPTDVTTDDEEAPAGENSDEPTEASPDDQGEAVSEEPLPEGTEAPADDIYPPEGYTLPVAEPPSPSEVPLPPEMEPLAVAPLPMESPAPPEGPTAPEAPTAPEPESVVGSPPPPGPIPEAPLPEEAPPPLPEADPTAAMTSLSRQRPGTRCFLCGSEMDGSYCPSCKMHWTE